MQDPLEPGTWEELYDHVNSTESRRTAVARKRAEEALALEQFETWRRQAIDQLMRDISAGAIARAEEFERRTGRQLKVAYPIGPAVTAADRGPEVRFLRLELGNAVVHVYTSHTPGSLTHVHLLPSHTSSLRKNERLVSEPGAFIVRRQDDGYELRYQRNDPEGQPSQTMQLDTLLFRAFRLLVRWGDD